MVPLAKRLSCGIDLTVSRRKQIYSLLARIFLFGEIAEKNRILVQIRDRDMFGRKAELRVILCSLSPPPSRDDIQTTAS
jgi:hypothetical protein